MIRTTRAQMKRNTILDLQWENWIAPDAAVIAPENGISVAEVGISAQAEQEYKRNTQDSTPSTSKLSRAAAA